MDMQTKTVLTTIASYEQISIAWPATVLLEN